MAVVGEVLRPGPHVVTSRSTAGENPSGNVRPPTISQAIQIAGGIQPEADLRSAKVYRRTRSGTQQIIDVDIELPTSILEQVEAQTGVKVSSYRIDFFGTQANSNSES